MSHLFTNPLIFSGASVLIAAWLFSSTPAHAQSVVNEDVEDGKYSGDLTSMKVPPKIMTEGSNNFLRITGSTEDRDSLDYCEADCPNRNRSMVTFTSSYNSMPLITSTNMRQTYSADIRLYDDLPSGGWASIFELFQNGKNISPPIRFIREKGHIYVQEMWDQREKGAYTDLGPVSAGTWHNYTIKAVWSHDLDVGRLKVYIDGKIKRTISGRDVNLGPDSNRLPLVKLGFQEQSPENLR
jgi:hypothetical protein